MFTGIRTRSETALVAPLFLVRVPERWPTALRWPLRVTNLVTWYLPAKVAPLLVWPVTLLVFSVPNSLVMVWAEAAWAPPPPTRATTAMASVAASRRA